MKITKYKLISLLVIIIIIVFIVLSAKTNLIFDNTKKTAPTTGNQYTKGINSSKASLPSNGSNNSYSSSTSSQGSTTQNKTYSNSVQSSSLIQPWGTFSNLNQATLNEVMESSCNTSPAATCELLFTNGSLTKNLESKSADSGGAVYWSWTPQSVGLTTGEWHMQFKATLGNQVKYASDDPLTLSISQ